MTISLNKPAKPSLKKLYRYLKKINEAEWYTNFGPLHKELTERLEAYLGVENLLLVSNGTLALQVAYRALNTKSALTTPFSFVATTSSLVWQGIETAFSDIDVDTYNLCPNEVKRALRKNKNIDTVVATHVYANPCDVRAFDDLAFDHNVKIIYDAAHAFSVKIGNDSILNFGDASILSFHATKVFHTGEGGAVIFKRRDDFERAKSLINFGIDVEGNINEIGINAKLNEYQCAVGLAVLDSIDRIIDHRSALFSRYRDGLKGLVGMPEWHPNASINGAYMAINLGCNELASKVEHVLDENNIQSRRYFSPSLDGLFGNIKNYGVDCSNNIAEGVVCLPLHYYMTMQDVNFVVEVVKGSLR